MGIAYGAQEKYRWRSIPITTVAQAKAGILGGEGFQQVMSIEYAPSDPRIVYMGSDTTQVWKSTDSGYHWRPASEGMDSNGARSLLVHPKNADIVLAAGFLGPEEQRARPARRRKEGIFRTVDGGKSWAFIRKTEFHKQRSTGSLFAVDPRTISKKELVLFAGSYSEGLLVSRDTGQTWEKTTFDAGIIQDIETYPAEPGVLIVASSNGLYRYDDGKIEKIGRGLPDAPSNIAISPAAPERVIAAVSSRGVYVSNDGGRAFRKSSRGLSPPFLSKVVDVFASPIDAQRLYAGTWKSRIKGPYYSGDGGKSWKIVETLNAHGLTSGRGFWFPSPFAPHPRKPLIALATSNGRTRVLRTENGGRTWHYSGSGFTGGGVRDMAFVSSEEWYLALIDHGLWRTTDGGKTFIHVDVPGVHPISIGAVAVSGRTIILSIGSWRKKRLAVSHDQGKTWQHFDNTPSRLKFIRFHPQKTNVVYASSYRSDDNGESWSELKYQVKAVFRGNGDIVYGFDKSQSRLMESSDMGLTWQPLTVCGGKKIRTMAVNEIAADPHVRGRLYLGTNSGPYLVDEGKCTRVGPKSGFVRDTHGSLAITSIAVNPLNTHVVYAGRWAPGKGTSSGVFRSDDFGHTWAPFNSGLGQSCTVWSIELDPEKGTVYIGATRGLHVLERGSDKYLLNKDPS